MFQGCFKGVSRVFKGYFKIVSKVFHECSMSAEIVLMEFRENFIMFQEYFKVF